MRGRRRDPLDGQGHLGWYLHPGGVRKISINYAGWTTNGRATTDSTVRTYSGDGTRIQKLTWSGVYDYKGGTAYRVRNPLNPASAPGRAKVKISLGVDGDGHGSCSVTFTQPGSVAAAPQATVMRPTWSRDQRRADLARAVALSSKPASTATPQQAARMAAERRMYHQDLGPILRACNLRAVGENVAYGYPSGSAVVAAGWDRAGTARTS